MGKVLKFAEIIGLAEELGGYAAAIDSAEAAPLATAEDAAALALALGRARTLDDLQALIGALHGVGTKEAGDLVLRKAVPKLAVRMGELAESWSRARADGHQPTVEHEAALEAGLKVLASFGGDDANLCLCDVALAGFIGSRTMWSVIAKLIVHRPGEARELLESLLPPLPEGPIGLAALEISNVLVHEQMLVDHPYDSPEGHEALGALLHAPAVDEVARGGAQLAASAIAFVRRQAAGPLLDRALGHKDTVVVLEAAWAAASLGDGRGLERLALAAADPRTHRRASQYLRELGREDLLPESAESPDFQAASQMCQWLAHPSELGKPPEVIEQVDRRYLYWPPTQDKRWLWVLRFRSTSDEGEMVEGQGLVGSITFALLGEVGWDMAPDDVLALHCCWELQAANTEAAPKERSVEAGRALLSAS